MEISIYIPDNLWIAEDAQNYPLVPDIIKRIQKLDPKVKPVIVSCNRPEYENAYDATDRFHEMKNTLLLCARSGSFLETFASPGHIVEGPATMVKTIMNCCGGCHVCYLNRTAVRQQWQKIYVNHDNLEQEMLNEVHIHKGLMTILSLASKYSGEPLLKIPKGFKELADDFRNKLSAKGRKEVDMIDVRYMLEKNISKILPQLIDNLDGKTFSVSRSVLESTLGRQIMPFSINVSEYGDIAGIDHIAGHLDILLGIVERNPALNIHFFTKFANTDALLRHEGDNRVKVVMNYNPQSIIDAYEPGTASLKERINVHAAIQAKGGYKSVVHIEPAFIYPGSEKDYRNLIRDIFKKVDPKRIEKVTLGMVRYTGQLMTFIERFYPQSNILDNRYELEKPEYGNDRYRYQFEERLAFYKMMIAEVRNYTKVPINLGAETPEIWEGLKLNPQSVLDKEFYQDWAK